MVCEIGLLCENELDTHNPVPSCLGVPDDSEDVIIAVFDDVSKIGDRVSPESFLPKRLGKGEVSVARLAHIGIDDFHNHVVMPGMARAPFVGVARAKVSDIRKLSVNIGNNHHPKMQRGVCVLAQVGKGDHESHAALQSCVKLMLGQARLGIVRLQLGLDLTRTFGVIEDINAVLGAPSANSHSTGGFMG
jgi:hypothetical protein